MAESFCPKNTRELYDKLCVTPGLRGDIRFIESNDNGYICWRLSEKLQLRVYVEFQLGESYVEVNHSATHWHPMNDEIYEQLCNIGRTEHILVLRKGILGTAVLYFGPKEDYRPEKYTRWFQRKPEIME